jgi:hypothetical protein
MRRICSVISAQTRTISAFCAEIKPLILRASSSITSHGKYPRRLKNARSQADRAGLPGFIIGQTGGRAGPMPFSAACRLTLPGSLMDDAVVACVVEFTQQSWDQLRAVVVACSQQQ